MRPLIGITMDAGHKPDRYAIWHAYPTAIEKAGGMPFLIPYHSEPALVREMLDRLDGILFTGGDDLDPSLYGQPRHPGAIPIDPDRQRFELDLLADVERRRLPALGICLGCQVFNVHRGGSLIQFLPEHPRDNPLEHRRLGDEIPRHAVSIVEGSVLHQAVGQRRVLANTYHKQAIERIGRNLRISATAPDGIIEAVEDPSLPLFLAVQWHPERLYDEPDHLALFRFLVEKSAACRRPSSTIPR